MMKARFGPAIVAVCLLASFACKRRQAPSVTAQPESAPLSARDVICLEQADGCVYCVGRDNEPPLIPPEQQRWLECDTHDPDSCVEFCSVIRAECALPWSKVPACVFESPDAFGTAQFKRDTADRPTAALSVRVEDGVRRDEGAVTEVWVLYRGYLTKVTTQRAGKDSVVHVTLPKGPWEYVFLFSAPGRATEVVTGVKGDKLDNKVLPAALRAVRLKPESTLRGTVVDAATGLPLSGARVRAFRDRSEIIAVSEVTSAEDGSFTVSGLDARSYLLRVEKLGWQQLSKAPLSAPAVRSTVKMTPVIAVNGTVLDAQAQPVSNATVIALSASRSQGVGGILWRWTTNADGRFEWARFEAGSYYFWARHGDLLTYPPVKVDFATGQHTDVELRLLHKGARASGRLEAESGSLSETVQVKLEARSPLAFPRPSLVTVHGGQFTATGLLPGTYALTVIDGDRKLPIVRGPKDIDVPINPGYSFSLPEPVVVRVR